MDQCTHEVRKQHWKNIITQCNQRPEGQTAKQWLDAHGICEQTYYRWQRLIRREIFAQTAPAYIYKIQSIDKKNTSNHKGLLDYQSI